MLNSAEVRAAELPVFQRAITHSPRELPIFTVQQNHAEFDGITLQLNGSQQVPTVFFDTFGCQMNVADSDMLADLLTARGYQTTLDSEEADLIIVNTCSVRKRAENRALAKISEHAGVKAKRRPNQALWVVGCMAERMGESLRKQIPGVNRVIGATKIEDLQHDIDHYLEDTRQHTEIESERPVSVSTFMPVMRGCDNFCTYCIVPHVRGREHSVPAETLVRRITNIVSRGGKEIVLLGQNVNSYRDDTLDFAGLLEKLHSIEGLQRIRFTTSHPKDLSERLIDAFADLPKLCNHLHLPVQSGSTRVLARMNRKYSREEYLGLVERIRNRTPEIDLTTDVMVGFPGETEEDYNDTIDLFSQVQFTSAFMFAFSAREGTAACEMDDQVADDVKKDRLSRLIEMQTETTKSAYRSMVGKRVSVLVAARKTREDHAYLGQNSGCKRVLLRSESDLTGTIIDAQVRESSGMTLIAEQT